MPSPQQAGPAHGKCKRPDMRTRDATKQAQAELLGGATDSTAKEDVDMTAPDSPKQMIETGPDQPAVSQLSSEMKEYAKQLDVHEDTINASGNDIFQLQEHTRYLEDELDGLSKDIRDLREWVAELNAVIQEVLRRGGQDQEDVIQRYLARMARPQTQHDADGNAPTPPPMAADRLTRLEEAVQRLMVKDATNGVSRLGI